MAVCYTSASVTHGLISLISFPLMFFFFVVLQQLSLSVLLCHYSLTYSHARCFFIYVLYHALALFLQWKVVLRWSRRCNIRLSVSDPPLCWLLVLMLQRQVLLGSHAARGPLAGVEAEHAILNHENRSYCAFLIKYGAVGALHSVVSSTTPTYVTMCTIQARPWLTPPCVQVVFITYYCTMADPETRGICLSRSSVEVRKVSVCGH